MKDLPLAKKKRENVHFMNRMQNDSEFLVAQQAKVLWEKVRVKELDSTTRSALITDLLTKLTGHIQALCLKHDASHIVQTCLKYGTKPQCSQICQELMGSVRSLCKSKYGKTLVKKLLTYSPAATRAQILSSELSGHILELVTHKEAAEIVEYLFTDIANAEQRNSILCEMYGREFVVGFKTSRWTKLDDVGSGETLVKIVGSIAELLARLVDKGIVRHSIVHRCASDFLQFANVEQRESFAGHVCERLLEMIHTRPGMLVGVSAVSFGSPKDRKQIVKSMKGYVTKVCTEEFGHLVLIQLLKVVDDTVLLKESVVKELCAEVIMEDIYARRVMI